jgi:hypothetical protein
MESSVSHSPEISGANLARFQAFEAPNFQYTAQLRQRYSKLSEVADNIRRQHNLDKIGNDAFQRWGHMWLFTFDYLRTHPELSESEQNNFITRTLSGPIMPASKMTCKRLKDPDLLAQLQPMEEKYPILSELNKPIYMALKYDYESIEKKFLSSQLEIVLEAERENQTSIAMNERDCELQYGKQQAFERLVEALRKAMGPISQ